MSNTNIYSIYKHNNYLLIIIIIINFHQDFLSFFFSYVFHLILLLAMEKDGWIYYNETM